MRSNTPYIPVIGGVAKAGKLPILTIGDRVIGLGHGKHGEIVSKRGPVFYVRWDDGTETSGGFGNFNLVREKTTCVKID